MSIDDGPAKPSPAITRGTGVTLAERYLQRLCEKSFLSLWSYAGIYRDQGTTKTQRTGKEVCDLLVVFDNHIIIFSDKYCEFPNTGQIELDWRRWFKRTIEGAAEQLWGAERWIRAYPNRLFLDRECSRSFPIILPDEKEAIFHRVVVAHGASDRCRDFFGGVSSGSLVIDTSIIGPQHYALSGDGPPFSIGRLDPQKGYVHVLDDTSLDIVLRTLDTVIDFVAYLEKKEQLINRPNFVVRAPGEEDLLGLYLMKVNEKDQHDFIVDSDLSAVSVGDGHWRRFESSSEYRAKRDADQISYVWDNLIETFNRHILAGTQYFASPGGIRDQEKIMRFLAREPRLHRRALAQALVDLIDKAPKTMRSTRVLAPSSPDEPFYVFLLIPQPEHRSYEAYRTARRNFLQASCRVVKVMYPGAMDIIGIATDIDRGRGNSGGSEDAIYLDARHWTEEDNQEAHDLQQKLDLLTSLKPNPQPRTLEYPVPGKLTVRIPEKQPLNSPCPCGSGKKYKMCHGRSARLDPDKAKRSRRGRLLR